jgi:DNA ligase (NAD+)
MSERVKKLEKLILKYKRTYYQGNPEISDESYDILEEELRQLAPESFVLNLVGTQVASKNQKKVKHNDKMLSLDKTYDEKDLIKWQGSEEIIGTYKIDGVSCSLIFESGRLVLAKTRGDGTYGEDITSKILWMDSIPKNIQYTGALEIRGEMYCPCDQFIKLADEMEGRKLERPSNQRNIVAGLMGRKDNIDLAKYIQFLAFDVLNDQEKISLEESKFDFLKQMDFQLPVWKKIKSNDECLVFLEDVKDFMQNGDFPIDGAVFSYNRIKLHRELGATSHHPKYKIAFKFKGDFKITSIESIEWGVSRNGILTPVAIVEPVELSGAQISRVTLHNWGVVRDNHLKVGDKIEITRSGEVIPKFLNVVESVEGKEHIPEACPSCGEKVREEDIRLYCPNEACPGRNKESILNYVQKIGIENLSDKRIEELLEKKIISDIPDLYDLSEEKLQLLDNVKDKMAKKLIESINQSRSIELITFLSALGFSG